MLDASLQLGILSASRLNPITFLSICKMQSSVATVRKGMKEDALDVKSTNLSSNPVPIWVPLSKSLVSELQAN
jgi:hypothetical protein